MAAEQVKTHATACAALFWDPESSGPLAAALADGDALEKLALGEAHMLSITFTEGSEAVVGEGGAEVAPAQEPSCAVSNTLSYSKAASYILLLNKQHGQPLDVSKPLPGQLQVVSMDGGTVAKELSPFDSFYQYVHSVFGPYVSSYIDANVEEGTKMNKAQADITTTMKKMESALAIGRDQYTVGNVTLTINSDITEALEGGATRAAVLDKIPHAKGDEFLGALEANVSSWSQAIRQITTMDRDASEGSALRDAEFFDGLEKALGRLKDDLVGDGVECTKIALQAGKKMFVTRQIDSCRSEVDKKLKFVESANKILKDLAISQLKGVTELEGLQPAILGLFTGKNGLNAEKFKRVFVPQTLWPRFDFTVLALTRDFTSQLREVLADQGVLSLSYSQFKEAMPLAKDTLSEWDAHVKSFYTFLVEVLVKEGLEPAGGKFTNQDGADEFYCRERVLKTTARFRKRILEVETWREAHIQLEKAIERVMGRSSGLSASDDILGQLQAQFTEMQGVDWLDGVGDVVERADVEGDGDDDDELDSSAWGKAKRKYESHVAKIEEVLCAKLNKMLKECKDANGMFRVFKKVNALFVRPAIKEEVQRYQQPLVENVENSIVALDQQFTMKYNKSEACLMSRVRDMTDKSGAIVWARQMERQLSVYTKQVEDILGTDWQREEIGKKLEVTRQRFEKKLRTTLDKALSEWLDEAGQDRAQRYASETVFKIAKSGGKYEMDVNFDPEAPDILKDYRMLKGIGLFDHKKHQRQLIQIEWIKIRYPAYRALADTLRTYDLTVARIPEDIAMLTATTRKAAQETLQRGVVQTKWTRPANVDRYAGQLGIVVKQLEEQVEQLTEISRKLENQLEDLKTCPATQLDFKKGIEEVQKTLNDMDLEENPNGIVWMDSFRQRVDEVLLERMRLIIGEWRANVDKLAEGGDDSVKICNAKQIRSTHRIRMNQDGITLDPPVMMARHHWLQQLHSCLHVITRQDKLTTSSYADALGDTDAASSSMVYLLEKLAPEFIQCQQTIEREITKAKAAADLWMRYRTLWKGNSQDVQQFMSDTHKDALDAWNAMLTNIRTSRDELDSGDTVDLNCAITVDYADVQTRVMEKYDIWHKYLQVAFAELIMNKTDEWTDKISDAKSKLESWSIDTGDTMQAIEFLNAVETIKKEQFDWGEMVKQFKLGEKLLSKERLKLKGADFKLHEDWKSADGIENDWASFMQIFEKRSKEVEKEKPKLMMKISKQDEEIAAKVKTLQEDWKSEELVQKTDISHKEMKAAITEFEQKIQDIDKDYTSIGQAKEILGIGTPGGLHKLDIIKDESKGLKDVWEAIGKIYDQPGGLTELREQSWRSVDARKTLKVLNELQKTMKEMPSRVRDYEAFSAVKGVLERCKAQNPIVTSLRSDMLKDRHWDNIRKHMSLPPIDSIVLGDMYDKDLLKNKAIIDKEVTRAQGEQALEEFIKTTRMTWAEYELELVNYQSKVRLIRGWDDLFLKLGENIAALQSMRLSPYFKVFADEADQWEKKLMNLNERFDIWVDVQRRWVYLETIFLGSAEIKHQLPQEHKRFMQIDGDFKSLHREVGKNPLALAILDIDEVLDRVTHLQDMLTKIQRALGDYLEKQRQQFARFYFVGDEDLLELIGSSKDPAKVQKHFSKMFAGISALVINELETKDGTEIIVGGMVSHANLETVPFVNAINVTQNPKINEWLGMLENEMRHSLAVAAENGIKELRELAAKCPAGEGFTSIKDEYLDWVSRVPSQCGLLMVQVQWTEAVETALACDGTDALEAVCKSVEANLVLLATQVLTEESLLQRKKLEGIITELVHQRTVIRDLLAVGKTVELSTQTFQWLYYMRFYWNQKAAKVEDRCEIRMADSMNLYGYEYQGVVERLVQTPLSDRAYLTLTQALHARLGGSPYGPAGTGKTETVKALGCQLGRYVLVFCCDENFDMHAMGRIFIGLCQVGAWGCFDEFNRLEERMLSACSQQIQVIQEGLMTEGDKIDLLGRNFVPKSDMGIFVTMNPGYAGRSELPDNLKQLLRACAMTAPDRELIAEVMLYSQGFNNAEPLSTKIVPLFNLCRDQLSAQPHYDFGLRALKAVLNSAGTIKRQMLAASRGDDGNDIDTQSLVAEQELIIRSISETVAPKLVGTDLPLLKTLMKDVFPGIKQENRVFVELMKCIDDEVKARHFKKGDVWLSKIIQLYQIAELHHGFMVVGPTGTGKTSAWEVLLAALGKMPKELGGREGVGHVIDPKSMTKDELYGKMDNTTREWTDGVFTKTLRKIIDESKTCPEDQLKTHWVVFDGDVDPVWVENLNSVLDDNKLLTLPNGERLALLPNIRIVFEVQDLKYATPATVSRCGMVWFSDNTVPLQDVVSRYLAGLRDEPLNIALGGEGMDSEKAQMVVQRKCADTLEAQIIGDGSILQSGLEEAMTKFTIMDFVPLQSMNSYFALVNVAIQKILDWNGAHEAFPMADEHMAKYVKRMSLKAVAWSCGGAMGLDDRLQFGRDLIGMTTEEVPDSLGFGGSNVSLIELDVNIDDGEWVAWRSMLPEQQIKKEQVGRSDVVITTEDTIRHVDTLTAYLVQRMPLILCGPPGSGKSMTMMSTLRAHPNLECVALNFSSSTDPELIMKVLDQYCVTESAPGGKGQICKPKQPGKWVVLFCDECNLPAADEYGTQMVIAFIRQLVEKGGYYRVTDGVFVKLERVQFLGACNPPTDPGREPLTHRFLRFAPLLLVDYPAVPSLKLIYGVFNQALLAQTACASMAESITNAMVETYDASRLRFTPDAQPHYIYSPRELTRWVRALREGIEGQELGEVEMMRLVFHEGLRLFRDRLTTPEEQEWTDEKMDGCFKANFPSLDCDTGLTRPILYCDWLHKSYVETGQDELRDYVRERLKTFADEELDVKLVVFDGVLDHVLRIDRVLKQPSGHMVLAGASGAGKTVLSRFVAWMNGLSIYTLKIHKKYSLEDFDEDLRIMMKRSGMQDEKICFIIDESNVISTAFMEKMNALLASGEVPGLFEGEDLNQLLNMGRERFGSDLAPDELFEKFTYSVCRNLHVVFTMNPANADFSSRTATSPALFNRCVVDWFGDWDMQALEQVADELTEQMGELEVAEGGDPMALRASVVQTTVYFHQLLKETSSDMLMSTGRCNHITPRHFTDLILHYTKLYADKKEALSEQQTHLNKGLSKLKQTEIDVQTMQDSLAIKNAELDKAGKEAEEKLSAMLVDQKEAEDKKATSETLSVQVKEQQGKIDVRKSEAEAELATVEPAIADAKQAVSGIKKGHLDEIRALANPPKGVQLTLEATIILMGGGKMPWAEIRKKLRDSQFIPNIMAFDSEKISKKARDALNKNYIDDPNFAPEKVAKSSRAAAPLCKWARAQLQYATVLAKAEPLRNEVKALEADAADLFERYNGLVAAAKEAEDRVAVLKQEYSVLIGHKSKLEAELEQVKLQADRAVALLGSLADERERWGQQQDGFQQQMQTVPGDALVAACFLAYAGYFNEQMRATMMLDLKQKLEDLQVPVKDNLSLSEYLSTPDDRLVWGRNGLPADNLCTENAVMLERFNRYPLLIDPSGQAVEFLLKQKKSQKIQKTSFLDDNFAKVLESAVRFGTAVLVQDVDTLDPILNPILNREVVKNGPRTLIRIGENEVDYSPSFSIFMSTRNPIANFAPDLCSRVTFVNFTITPSSLQSQCLSELLKVERPDIQKMQEEQLKLQGEFQAKLVALEEDLLNTLNAAEGNLLEDTSVITKMQHIKKEATEVAEKMDATKEVQAQIDEVNNFYRRFAVCLSRLYFMLEDMGGLHFLYQFTLNYFLEIFGQVLHQNENLKSAASSKKKPGDRTEEERTERLTIMIDDIFGILYRKVVRGLLDADRMVMAFRLGQIRLDTSGTPIDATDLSVFLKGALQPAGDAAVPEGLMTEDQESGLKDIVTLSGFSELSRLISDNQDAWRELLQAGEPERLLVAGEEGSKFEGWEGDGASSKAAISLRRLLVLKALRPDRLMQAMSTWVEDVLGDGFLTLPSVGEELATVVRSGEGNPKEPFLLVNRPGHDASFRIDDLERELKPKGGMVSLAMGSPETYGDAEKQVTAAAKRGSWVMLKNVHLATDWLNELEKQIHSQASHKDFRLFLTMEFTPKVPANLVRVAQVFVFEPPSGVIASLRQTMASVPPERMKKAPAQRAKLHFLLAWFHAVTVDRLRFSPLGWSTYYEFNASDLRCGESLVSIFCVSYQQLG
jgi:dynein heavy chain 1